MGLTGRVPGDAPFQLATLKYDEGVIAKVRKTLTLDADVVEMFQESDQESLSAAVNLVLRAEQERRARRAALAAFVADLEARHGEPDPAMVEEFRSALR